MAKKRAPLLKRMTPELARQQAIADLIAVCQTPSGRRVVWGVIHETRVWDSIRAPSPDIHYNEGRRSVGIWLMEWVDAADPTLIPLMMQEARNADLVAETARLRAKRDTAENTENTDHGEGPE